MDKSEIIIENVKNHECLYSLSSKDYKNVNKKTEIWKDIGRKANLSAEECRKRWKGLRDTYKRRKRMAQIASGGGAPSPSQKWKYMELLQFLDGSKDARETIGSIEDQYVEFEHLFDCSLSSIGNEYTAESNDLSEVRPKKATKKHTDAEVTSIFNKVIREFCDSVKELAAAGLNEGTRDSTSLLFETLAKKITEANLLKSVVAKIESKVVSFVYEEIAQNLPSSACYSSSLL